MIPILSIRDGLRIGATLHGVCGMGSRKRLRRCVTADMGTHAAKHVRDYNAVVVGSSWVLELDIAAEPFDNSSLVMLPGGDLRAASICKMMKAMMIMPAITP